MPVLAVVGTEVPRLEGREKVTGATVYAADVHLPGELRGKILRSREPHAILKRVDATRARALPGVHAVLTGADVPAVRLGVVVRDMPILCTDRVRFIGDPIAAVAAESASIAEDALRLIDVEYESLPGVFDAQEALSASAPLVHPDAVSYEGRPKLPDIPNLQAVKLITKGNVEQGFAEADHVFEHTFTTAPSHQGYIEPRACMAHIEPDGTVRFWSSCQAPYRLRDLLAELLELPTDRVIVERTTIGGSFGAKGGIGPEGIAYFLAKATGQPVKIVPPNSDDLTATNSRHQATITLKTGVRHDGTLVARKARVIMDGGAYAGPKVAPGIGLPSVSRGLGPYRIPHTEIEALWAYTNQLPGGIARAPGQPQVVFAGESQMDIIAQELGIEPLELRLKNAIVEGDVWPDNGHFTDVMVRPALELLRATAHWDAPLGPNRGRGMAVSERSVGAGTSGLVLSLNADGTVTALSAIPDCGTGAFTILRQVVAEEMHLPMDAISITTGNTNEAPEDAGIGGSKHTFSLTMAVLEAAGELKTVLQRLAAQRLEAALEDTELVEDGYQARGHPGSRVPMRELVAEAAAQAGGRVSARSKGPGHGAKAPQSCIVAYAVEVEVDPESGRVTPLKVTAVHDVGRAMNPQLLQAQIDGGTVQGLGQALMEDLAREGGRIMAANLGDYKLPGPTDVPELVSVLVEGAPGPGPYGAKSVGELSHVPIPAAVANAVANACGARVFDLPISAERVRRALRSGITART